MAIVFLHIILAVITPEQLNTSAAQIHIDLRHPGPRVSPTLYGLFFEEINHSGDGGLYGEMVRNGSFEDSKDVIGWQADLGGNTALDTTSPLNPSNKTSLRFDP